MDVVLLDHQLPDTTGLEVLEAIRARPQPPAVILITAHGNESLAATALRRGADDYLAKDVSLAELLPQVLERVRRTRELRKALVAAERDLVRAERLAAIGEMTVTLHHEINNPLMAAFAHVELLLADPAMDADAPPGDPDRRARGAAPDPRHHAADRRPPGDPDQELRDRDPDGGPGRCRARLGGAPRPGPGAGDRRGPGPRSSRCCCKHAGFEVVRAGDGADLEKRAAGGQTRLVVAQGGTDAAGAHPLGGFVPPAGRAYRVVALVSGDGTGAEAAGADHVVELPFDPGAFTAEVIELTGGD